MRRTTVPGFLLVVSLQGCGKVADSTEGTAAAAGWTGTGGAGGVGGASTGGAPSGGAAGAPCDGLTRVGDVIEVLKPSGDGLNPALVALGASVEVVFETTSPSGKTIVKGDWLSPWSGAWSPPLVGAAAIFADVNDPFVAAANAKKSTSAVLHGVAGAPCLRLATIDPQDTLATIGSCTSSPPVDVGAPRLLLARSDSGPEDAYVVAYESGGHQLSFASVSGAKVGAPGWLGCATSPLLAAGWSSPSGTLVAFSTSRPFQTCGLDAWADGPPTRLQIARLGDGADPSSAELRHELTLTEPIVALRLAPRADGGAWVVFQTALGIPAGPLRALAVDAQGKPTSELVDVVDPGDVAPFALAPMGNRALLVWYPFPVCKNEPCAALRFHRLDDSTQSSTAPIHVEPLLGAPLGSLSLASSPDAKSAIAAWHDLKGMPSQLFAARFDCAN
ncbi:MAG: hypothetical protein KJ015_25165 [Myxococcales bacterium]|nr:hypothetical protein [Myxococcales bacterium]